MDEPKERYVYRKEVRELFGISYETMKRWIKTGKLPPPEVAVSAKRTGWKLSTLRGLGIGLLE